MTPESWEITFKGFREIRQLSYACHVSTLYDITQRTLEATMKEKLIGVYFFYLLMLKCVTRCVRKRQGSVWRGISEQDLG